MQKKSSSPLCGGLRGASAILMLLFSIAISFVALFTPPPGVIDPSVLWLVAQALLFAASAFGLDAFIRQMTDKHGRDKP